MQESWGIIFGGGFQSIALIISCRMKGLQPNWIVFVDTGSEYPETLSNVENMKQWCQGWVDVAVITSFEALHNQCLRTRTIPSKALGYAVCMTKWKKNPIDNWLKDNGYAQSNVAIAYTTTTSHLMTKPCSRGDDPSKSFLYPLIEWGYSDEDCARICKENGFSVHPLSSCFICPNTNWSQLAESHPSLYEIAVKVDGGSSSLLGYVEKGQHPVLEDRCRHSGCFN